MKPRASARGLPVFRSPAIQGRYEPTQAASRSLNSTLASSQASAAASNARSPQPWVNCSPNLVHPTPMIAICSFKRPAIFFPPYRWPGLPEIVGQSLAVVKLSKPELTITANPDILGVYIRHLAIEPASTLEVDHSQCFRRIGVEINIIIRVGIDPTLTAQRSEEHTSELQ